MVLLLKGEGDYWDIGLVKVLWKVCEVVLNLRLNMRVDLY